MSEPKLCLDHSVVIHIAKPSDLLDVFDLVDEYADGIKIEKGRTKQSLRDLVYSGQVMVFKYEETTIGGVAGYNSPCLFTDDVFYNVMFFYVRQQFRFLTKEIIKEMELVLLPTKVTKLVFGIPISKHSEKYKRYYKMMGYRELETHVYKRI